MAAFAKDLERLVACLREAILVQALLNWLLCHAFEAQSVYSKSEIARVSGQQTGQSSSSAHLVFAHKQWFYPSRACFRCRAAGCGERHQHQETSASCMRHALSGASNQVCSRRAGRKKLEIQSKHQLVLASYRQAGHSMHGSAEHAKSRKLALLQLLFALAGVVPFGNQRAMGFVLGGGGRD